MTAASTAVPVRPETAERARPLSGRRTVTLAAVYYLLAALALTLWLWRDPASRMVAGNPNDADQFAWFFRYDATAVAHWHLPALVTTAMNAPQGVNVMWNTFMLLPGIVLAPVTLAWGPQVSLTLLLSIGFAGSATAMFAVLRRWQVSVPGAALGAAVYGFSPALLHSAIGHYDLQFAVFPPLIADAVLRLATGRASARRGGLWLGLLVTAQLFISEEILFDTGLATILLLIVIAASRPRDVAGRIAALAGGLGTAACVMAVIAGYPLWVQFFGPLHENGSPFTTDFFKNDLSGFVVPSSYLLFHTAGSAAEASRYQGLLPEYLGYLGWPLIAVLAAGTIRFWRRLPVRASAVAWAVLEVFSLGGTLLASGHEHALDQAPLVLAAEPARAQRGAARPVLHRGRRRGRRAAGLLRRRGRPGPDRVRPVHSRPPAAAAGLRRRGRPRWSWAAPSWPSCPSCPGRCRPPPRSRCRPAGRRRSPRCTCPPRPPCSWSRSRCRPSPNRCAGRPTRASPRTLVGGYFMGPAGNGRAYIDGSGLSQAGRYLNFLWAESGAGLPASLTGGVPASADRVSPGYVRIEAVSKAKMLAQIAAWHVTAVVAVTVRNSVLGDYLTSLLGPPAVVAGDVMAWRT